jgi:hypothetical protein
MKQLALLSVAALLIPQVAGAFGGVFVGAAGDNLTSSLSQVVVVREGNQTTMTLAAGYEGDATQFGLVIPVPVVVEAADIKEIEPTVIEYLDVNAAPRAVSHNCDDFYFVGEGTGLRTNSCSSCGSPPKVISRMAIDPPLAPEPLMLTRLEPEFLVGEWLVTPLTEAESEEVVIWLETAGYAIDSQTALALQEHVVAGSAFVVARMTLDQAPSVPSFLPPLQLTFEAYTFEVPTKLGTLNAVGSQELLITGIGDFAAGQLSIGNLAERPYGDQSSCLYYEHDWDSFDAFFAGRLDEVLDEEGSWALEFSWGRGECSCNESEYLTDNMLAALGFEGAVADAFVTRLRARYSAQGLTDDLVLYHSGGTDFFQALYVEYLPEMEEFFALCGEDDAENPTTCEDTETAARRLPPGPTQYGGVGLGALMLLGGFTRRWRFKPRPSYRDTRKV